MIYVILVRISLHTVIVDVFLNILAKFYNNFSLIDDNNVTILLNYTINIQYFMLYFRLSCCFSIPIQGLVPYGMI